MSIRFFKAAVLLAITVSNPVFAANTAAYYGEKEDGWFWYKDPALAPKPKPKPPEEPKPTPEPKEAKPAPFSVEWLRANIDKLRDDAIENPDDKDKVTAYLYAVQVMMDKAQNFANAAHEIATTDPLLDNNNRIPLGSASKSAMLSLQEGARKEIMAYLKDRAGLWFFFDSKCSFCSQQNTLLNTFKLKNPDFIVRNITMDGVQLPGMKDAIRDQGQAKRLGLKITPTLVLAVPPNTFAIVSQGLITAAELEDKMIMSSRIAKVIPEDMMKKYQIYEKGVLKTDDFKDLEGKPVNMDDPASWVKYLQEKLQARF